MNVTLPESSKINKKYIIIYGSIILFCVIALIVASYVQFYARIDIAETIGIKEKQEYGFKSETEIQKLKTNFDSMFNNKIENDTGNNNNKKVYKDKELVCTKYEKKEKIENNYDMNINIPYINIKNSVVEKYNDEIEETFADKARSVLESKNKNIIYTVEYTANIDQDIVSLIIKSTLKEGSNAQRVIIKTYNYDLRNNKEISLQEILRIEQLEKQRVQDTINNTIKEEQNKVESLEKLGYNIYKRDLTNTIYKVENTNEFYYLGDTIYIIYPYGNDSNTSEMDLVII